MPRLRTVSTQQPGWTRVRHGRGFRYLDQAADPLEAGEFARVKALAIPPAWRDVWISPFRLSSDSFVEEHGSYGLTTLERRHVTRCDGG